jgi:hypothetical protein
MAPPLRDRRAIVAAVLILSSACGHRGSDTKRAALIVPRAAGAIALNGEQVGTDWNGRATRVVFTAGTEEARPHSEARFLRDDHDLFIGLYAADEDVRSTDAFDVAVGALAMHVDVKGRITPSPPPGVRVAVDVDEETTIDKSDDFDEEWKIVLAIPLDRLGVEQGAPIAAKTSRCDTPKDGITRCGAWEGDLSLAP